MVVVKLIGGLGNQMFCYAVGKAMALEKKTELYIDKSWINQMEIEKNIDLFGIDYFESNYLVRNIKTNRWFNLFDNKYIWKIYKKFYMLFLNIEKSNILIETKFNFHKEIFSNKFKNLYLKEGYWQSYKYFEKYSKQLREEYTFKKSVYLENKVLADEIFGLENTVSIHIRRGDYIKNAHLNKIYGNICNEEYYLRAVEILNNKLKQPIFYVFSDDLEWAKKLFENFDNIRFVDNNLLNVKEEIGHQDKGYCDMYLMSLCKNNIIANSSFSWWGAWLNSNTDKIVIAPKKWFNDSRNTEDLIPKEWVRV